MNDEQTIAVYNKKVDDYRAMTKDLNEGKALEQFMAATHPGGLVLDLGCGPGKSSALMHSHGFGVDPVDASTEMVKMANAHFPINARLGSFSSINSVDHYHGVWANFSLLHASREDFPHHLSALFKALITGGTLHLGMKIGEGSHRDNLGRFYTFYTPTQLSQLLENAGFQILVERTGEDKGLAGTLDPWVTILSRKPDSVAHA